MQKIICFVENLTNIQEAKDGKTLNDIL